MNKVKKLFQRIYSDYFMPSRLYELKEIYQQALSNGYEIHSIVSFYKLIKNNEVKKGKKYFINRHDIDTGIKTTKKIFQLEKDLGIKASYYFRLSTLDFDLMKEINAYGSEASYHFEEIATLAKKYHWKKEPDINYQIVKEEFVSNFSIIKKKLGFPMLTVCSHGDFVNRKLQVVNHKLLDESVRDKVGIQLETYDDNFCKYITSRHSDTLYPNFYKPNSPLNAILKKEEVIYLLTHPRHWHTELIVNTKDNFSRLIEGIKYKLGTL